jgi:hypothetical protein
MYVCIMYLCMYVRTYACMYVFIFTYVSIYFLVIGNLSAFGTHTCSKESNHYVNT